MSLEGVEKRKDGNEEVTFMGRHERRINECKEGSEKSLFLKKREIRGEARRRRHADRMPLGPPYFSDDVGQREGSCTKRPLAAATPPEVFIDSGAD